MKISVKDHPDLWGKLLRAAAQIALIYAEKLDPTEEKSKTVVTRAAK